MGHGNGFLAQALHVKRELFLALRQHHAGVEKARFHHRAQAPAQAFGVDGRCPGAHGLTVVVEHTHQAGGQIGRVGGGGVDGGLACGSGSYQAQVRKIGFAAGPAGRLRHMQPQGGVRCHPGSPCARLCHAANRERDKTPDRGAVSSQRQSAKTILGRAQGALASVFPRGLEQAGV